MVNGHADARDEQNDLNGDQNYDGFYLLVDGTNALFVLLGISSLKKALVSFLNYFQQIP